MPHQDQGRSASGLNLAAALEWLVVPRMLGRLAFRKDCSWTPQALVQAALLWAWGEEAALTERYFTARQTIARQTAGQRQLVSYQAFVKLLLRHSGLLLFALSEALQRQMREALAETYRVGGWLAFGADGSRVDAPRTRENERAFGAARCKTRKRGRRRKAACKKAAAPRLWLTVLWHLGTGLPWSWTRGGSDASERGHLVKMLPALPERCLLLADAGFVGYDFWQALLTAGHGFVIRVGANVTLLKSLGYFRERAGRVYLWPEKQCRRGQPPLVLRLVVAHDGKHPVYLVTSILEPAALSDRQLIELYRARWGVEVFFRSFKQTFGRRKLHSTSPDNARLELDWSLAALWAACLYAKVQQREAGHDPAKTSVAGVLRILRRALHDPQLAVAALLAQALVDDYQRGSKASRDYPRQKTQPPSSSPPTILQASKSQVLLAQQLRRLTA